MKNPAALSQRMLMSDELGHSWVKSQSLRFLVISDSRVLKNSLMSSSTEERSTSCSLRTSVMGRSDSRRNPDRIGGSGRPVIKNLTFGISSTYRDSTERMAEAGSSSLHSSRASMMMRVGMPVALSAGVLMEIVILLRLNTP